MQKKLLIVLYYYHPYVSGLSLLAKMLAEGLAARGNTVTVLTMQYDKNLSEHQALNGVNIVRAKVLGKLGKGLMSVDFLIKLVQLSKTHDVVNPHLPMAHIGLALPLIDNNKLMPQYHCDLNLGPGIVSKVIERVSYWLMGKTLERSSKIIVTTKDYFSCSHFSRFLSRTCEIYPPVDESRFGKREPTELRARLGIKTDTKLIGFVGRIVAEKGLEYLLKAIPILENRLDDFMVLVAGEHTKVAGGSVKHDVDVLVNKHPDRVKLVGHLRFDDLVAFYNLIDVLVLPSVDPLEAFGMVQVEAMLCGTPVVASDMPGVREVINRTGFGRLVRPRDPQDIADRVCELLESPVNIPREALADFNYDRIIDQYEEVFSSQIRSTRYCS